MLTEEQQKKIISAVIATKYKTTGTTADAILAGIETYDEMKDVEDVKVAAKAASNSKTEEMLLDEAIKHYLDKALNDVSFTCKRDHLRVASWLSELRVRRSRSADGND